MRVIAGRVRRRLLDIAPGGDVRPFLEKARGAVFNSLGDRVAGARVLDLFAGSGALGIEALSRGAEACTFVESDAKACEVLRGNLQRCDLLSCSRVLHQSVVAALGSLAKTFDLIFLDPPFPLSQQWFSARKLPEQIAQLGQRLSPSGRLMIRTEQDLPEGSDLWPGLDGVWQRRYGRSEVALLAPGSGRG